MTKQKTAPIAPPTMLTITLPNDGPMPRTGTLLAQKGDVGQLRRFEYRSLAEVSTALKEALLALHDLAKQPPLLTVSATDASPEATSEAGDELATPTETVEFQATPEEPFVAAHVEEIAVDMPATDQLTLF